MSRVVWCLECERVGRSAVTGEEERCSYDDCNAWEWDLWPWKGPFQRDRYYLQYSAEQMQGVEDIDQDEDAA